MRVLSYVIPQASSAAHPQVLISGPLAMPVWEIMVSEGLGWIRCSEWGWSHRAAWTECSVQNGSRGNRTGQHREPGTQNGTAGSQGGERKTEKKRNKKNKKGRRKNERENGGEQISQGEVRYIDINIPLALLFITLINFFNCISLWKLYIVKLF